MEQWTEILVIVMGYAAALTGVYLWFRQGDVMRIGRGSEHRGDEQAEASYPLLMALTVVAVLAAATILLLRTVGVLDI